MSRYDEFDDDKFYEPKISKKKIKSKSNKSLKFKDLTDDEDLLRKKSKARTSYERKLDRTLKNHESI